MTIALGLVIAGLIGAAVNGRFGFAALAVVGLVILLG
jgi:hypothetical protein